MAHHSKPARTILLSGLFLLLLASGCSDLKVATYYERGALASESSLAADIGRTVFKNGGNAFDVAVAVGFTMAVVHPQAGNIAGGGFAVIRDAASGDIRTLDFRETAPSAATTDLFLDESGNVIDNASLIGARAAGVPGTVAGLHALWSEYGSMPWEDLVRIAADLADSGFVVNARLAADFDESAGDLMRHPATVELFAPEGRLPQEGERLVLPELAQTLYTIAAQGPAGFYEGRIADLIDSTMQAQGGLITTTDLANYRPVWRDPLIFTFDSLAIYSMAPPSSGGIVIGQILKLLEPYDFSTFTPRSPEYIHLFTEAARLAYADRSSHLGDPDFYPVPDLLLDKGYLDQRRGLLNEETAGSSEEIGPGNPFSPESDNTTHISVCDGSGNMVALTYTLNSNFGSGLVVAGGGFLLNNQMDDFAIKPGVPNQFGLVGDSANRIEPNKRMLSSMAPTLVMQNNKPFLILGSRGGSKIITQVAQAIIDYTRFDLSLQDAMSYRRFHHQWLPDVLYLEQGQYDVATIQRLIRYGHNVEERSAYGGINAITIDDAGLMQAAVDPRTGGKAIGY